MNNKDFIGQMVQDTIEKNEEKSNLYHFSDNEVDRIIHFDFDHHRKCHLLKHKKEVLEVPSNWGPFKNRISSNITLFADDDKYLFLDMLNTFLGSELRSVKIITASHVELFEGQKAA